MIKEKAHIVRAFELDGQVYRLDGAHLLPVAHLQDLTGDTWLVTDFGEARSRFISVEGPVKFAEILVRRKLQESGEFEEPVEIVTHWKRKRGKSTTDIFFTAVPTRLTRIYFDELRAGKDHTLVFAMYGVLWDVIQRMGAKSPVAVIFRHDRFAEVVIGARNKVYFANRCVAFDTQEEQIQALWENVRADIEAVQRDQRIEVSKVACFGWVDACEQPLWPEHWQKCVEPQDAPLLTVADRSQPVSWPLAAQAQSARRSVSPAIETALFYARRWAPMVNGIMLAMLVLLVAGALFYQYRAHQIEAQVARLRGQIGQIALETTPLAVSGSDFTSQLRFVQTLDHARRQPSYQQVVNDLTEPDFFMLRVQSLKLAYGFDALQVELYGDIEAPFDQAHGRYKGFLQRLLRKGYHIEESRFETQISKSQVVLKLTRPIA